MTNLFTWSDSLSTGFGDVDLQHKKLINIIGEVNDCLLKTGTEYELGMAKIIKKLSDYTQYHFSEEQSLMRKYDYPGIIPHIEKHDDFVIQLQRQISSLPRENPAEGYQFYRFLGNWLLAHIAKEDHAWAVYIQKILDTV